MDREMMVILIFVVILVSIVANTIKEVAKRGIAFKERQLELQQSVPAPAINSDTAAWLDQMEQRLRVLERIATDRTALPSAELAREIEALRSGSEEAAGAIR